MKRGVELLNVIIASESEIKFDVGSSNFDVGNSYVLTNGKIDVGIESSFSIDHGYFYAGEEMEIKFEAKPKPSKEFCGSMISHGEVKLGEKNATFSRCGPESRLIWH